MKNCSIMVSAENLYLPEQPSKTLTMKAAKIEETEAAAVSLSMTQLSRKSSLKESLQQIGQQCEEMEKRIEELEDQVSNLMSENTEKEQMMHQLNEQIQNLDGELQEKVALINQQQEKLSTNEVEIEKLHNELRDKQEEINMIKEESEQQLRDQQLQHEQQLWDKNQQHEQALAEQQYQNEQNLREQQEHHQQEEDHLQQELNQLQQQVAQLQQDLQEMTDQKQQLHARVETAFAYMRGDLGTTQVGFDAIELWEVPREDVHVSNKILGTGGWGYVAEGMFRGQKVAVKCLHRGILSQFTTNHVRREISIMAQIRHPNLVLLIGAILNADTGPLIITELLDRTLRSAYEEHLLEEHFKFPILRDVAAALNYLHSHRRPIIHRDISSANVLLEAVRNNAWKAKLSDFGSANLIRLATTPAEGAVTYSAPEVRTEARNQQTPKVDVYSFGVLLCEISLCQFPPDPREFAAFLASVRDNADPRLYELAQNCTKHDPEERPSMRDVLTQIGELIPME